MAEFKISSTTKLAEGEDYVLADADFLLIEAIRELTKELRKGRLNRGR